MKHIIFFANGHTKKNQISGGDVRFREIAKRLNQFEKYIVTSKFGHNIYLKENINAKYILISNDTKEKNIILLYLQRTFKSLFLDVTLSKNDILYSISDLLPNIVPAFILKSKYKKVNWVQIIHHLYKNPFKREGNSFLINLLGYLSQKLSFILIKRKADLIIVVNPIVKKELIKIGFNEKKINVNYNGIDLKKINNIRPSKNNNYDCVFLGRLNASKGIFDLIEIWMDFTKKHTEVTLAMIGGGNNKLEQELKKLVKKCNLEKNIHILGYLDDEEAFGILKSSKIFVFPSHEEGFGISILEAMTCGLPVVAYDLSTYKSIYGNNILKVPIGDFKQFAENILKLLNEKQIRDDIGLKGQEFIQKYDWDEIAEEELKILQNMY